MFSYHNLENKKCPVVNILPGMNAGASTYAVPSPIKGSGTAWVLLGSWALSPARPTPIPPRHECRGFSALLVTVDQGAAVLTVHALPDFQPLADDHERGAIRPCRRSAVALAVTRRTGHLLR